jgi:hypothetical protein
MQFSGVALIVLFALYIVTFCSFVAELGLHDGVDTEIAGGSTHHVDTSGSIVVNEYC